MDPITDQLQTKLSEIIEDVSKQDFIIQDGYITENADPVDSSIAVRVKFIDNTRVVVVPKREWESILYLRNIQLQHIESYKKKLDDLKNVYERDVESFKRVIQLLVEE